MRLDVQIDKCYSFVAEGEAGEVAERFSDFIGLVQSCYEDPEDETECCDESICSECGQQVRDN